MRISFCCVDTDPAPWLADLRAALPQATVELWSSGARQADYAVVWGAPQQFFDEQPQLKAIFNTGAGIDALRKLRLPPQATLVRLEDAGMAAQMAEYVCHAVIRRYREFAAIEADVARGHWQSRMPSPRAHFPVGVMGLGVLGAKVAQALTVFDFPVNGWSRSAKTLPGVNCFTGSGQLSAFLASTNVLVCLLPLTHDTRDILCQRTLSQLQPGGYVINVARGAHLVDEDLLALIASGHVSGATLDVFRTEPLPPDHAFWQHPKITITPHTSARTLRAQTVAQIVGKLKAMDLGEAVTGRVNAARGY